MMVTLKWDKDVVGGKLSAGPFLTMKARLVREVYLEPFDKLWCYLGVGPLAPDQPIIRPLPEREE